MSGTPDQVYLNLLPFLKQAEGDYRGSPKYTAISWENKAHHQKAYRPGNIPKSPGPSWLTTRGVSAVDHPNQFGTNKTGGALQRCLSQSYRRFKDLILVG